MIETLEIRLLGQFEVCLGGQTMDIPSRPAQALLAYLALKPGLAHRREQLAGLVWPEATEANARGYLRQALWRIRKGLQTSGQDYLTADELTVTFDANHAAWVDVAELECETAGVEALLKQVGVYQGHLLPGFYYDWVQPERDRLQAVFESKLNRLLEGLMAEHRWAAVLEWGERWIALGHAPEPAFRALMTAHLGLGDRSSAANAYRRCIEALQRELGVEPTEATRTLYERVRLAEGGKDRSLETVVLDRTRHFAALQPSELPRQLTSFIGRERELAEVARLLAVSDSTAAETDDEGRLVTLAGVGGCGKTRLALRTAEAAQTQAGWMIWFVDLAPVIDPALLLKTVAAALGLIEEPGQAVIMLLTDYLRARPGLLILDNCEHLVSACADLVNGLRQACPKLRILATSREALGVAGEMVFQVPSLSLPDQEQTATLEDILGHEAIRLFVERAAAVVPDFRLTAENAQSIIQICARLDGIPLAIELAAARVKLLSPEQIAARLSDRFRLLTGGSRTALPRQQTLRATMDWSYNLLSDREHAALRRLAVFAGGCDLEAAEAVLADGAELSEGQVQTIQAEDVLELLAQLVNKSLVQVEQGQPQVRYRLLDTIRQYAREKLLDADEVEAVRQRHLIYFRGLGQQGKSELVGPGQVAWVNRLETELDNLRAALEWALECDVEAGLILATALGRFWDVHNYSYEAAHWLEQLLQRPVTATAAGSAQAMALAVLSNMQAMQGRVRDAQASAELSLELHRALGDKYGEAYSLMQCGGIWVLEGDITLGRPVLEQSLALFTSLGDKLGRAEVLSWLSLDRRNDRPSQAILRESLALNRELGHLAGIAGSLVGLAQQQYWDGQFDEGPQLLEEAMALQQQLGSQFGISWVLENYGNLNFRMGRYEEAERYYEESAAVTESVGHYIGSLWARMNLAHIALRGGDTARARAMFTEYVRAFRTANITIGVVYGLEGFASLAVHTGQPERAARLIGWADGMRQIIGDPRPYTEQVDLDRDIASVRMQLDETTYAAACAAGRVLTLEQALAYALEPAE